MYSMSQCVLQHPIQVFCNHCFVSCFVSCSLFTFFGVSFCSTRSHEDDSGDETEAFTCSLPCVVPRVVGVVSPEDSVDLNRFQFEERQVLRCLAAPTLNCVEDLSLESPFWKILEDFRCRNCRPSPKCRGLGALRHSCTISFHDFRDFVNQVIRLIRCQLFHIFHIYFIVFPGF